MDFHHPNYTGSGSIKYSTNDIDITVQNTKLTPVEICVLSEDIVDTGIQFINYNPLVLNVIDDSFSGEYVQYGIGAGEESIFRRSNYFRTLNINFNPIKNNEVIYSPDVSIFKMGQKNGFQKCSPFKLSFVACSGINYPKLKEDGRMYDDDLQILENKIDLIFKVAIKHNHRSIILSAFGCGVWKNNPENFAPVFRKIIDKYKNTNVIELVVFTIIQK